MLQIADGCSFTISMNNTSLEDVCYILPSWGWRKWKFASLLVRIDVMEKKAYVSVLPLMGDFLRFLCWNKIIIVPSHSQSHVIIFVELYWQKAARLCLNQSFINCNKLDAYFLVTSRILKFICSQKNYWELYFCTPFVCSLPACAQ